MTTELADLAAQAGIALRYSDVTQTMRETPPETLSAVLEAMGIDASTPGDIRDSAARLTATNSRPLPTWVVVEAGKAAHVTAPETAWQIQMEGGQDCGGTGGTPLPALPAGYHRLIVAGQETLLLAAPPRLPAPAKDWGVTLPLYGLRPADRGGFGDYGDLRAAVLGLGRAGASFVGINPVHAGFPRDPKAFSPYMPSSRQRLNTAHIALPGIEGRTGPLIDYENDLPAKHAALAAAFAEGGDAARAEAEAFAGDDSSLWRFATHQALSDRFGAYWTDWPVPFQDHRSAEVAAFATENRDQLLFHVWCQMRAAEQLDAVRDAAHTADMAHGLYLDLAVGTHPAGAETWADGSVFARKVSLGAPPDGFSPDGQTWGLAPFNPVALANSGFQVFIDTLRAQFRFARLLRIDHVLGFERAFWVPGDGLPGAYVTMPKAAMLAITRIEASRAGATVIGEDLGNVPDGLRADLAKSGILGCRVALFERKPGEELAFRGPHEIDEDSLTSFSTHDLPTWRGWRKGRDIDWWQQIGHMTSDAADRARAGRQDERTAFDAAAGTEDGKTRSLNRYLRDSTARLVAVQLEDLLELEEQANLPGTVTEHPNWRRRVPVAADRLESLPAISDVARDMAERAKPSC